MAATAHALFGKAFNGRPGQNFMTPDIKWIRRISPKYIVEWSEGTSIFGNFMVGITVVSTDGDKPVHDTDKSMCFITQGERNAVKDAQAYINKLKEE